MKKNLFLLWIGLLCSQFTNAQKFDTEPEARLTQAQINDFRDQAQRTISALSDYISTIGNKQHEMRRRQASVGLASKLFMTDSNVVEVSSLNKPTQRIPNRTYLSKLLLLPYDRTTIKWYDVYLSPSFHEGQDGRYYGVATVYQKFEGVTNSEFGNRKYIDITKKDIQIIIEKQEEQRGDKKIIKWRLFLGDITVTETRDK